MNACKIRLFYTTKDVVCGAYRCVTDLETEYKYLKLKGDKLVNYKNPI